MRANDKGAPAVLVMTTTADDDSASRLARTLVDERLAACVSRSAVRSVFRWDAEGAGGGEAGNVCEEAEVLLVIKTSATRVEAMEKRLLELHPYECPELIRIEPGHVDARYLAWLVSATS